MNTGYWLALLALCAVLFAIGLFPPRRHKKHKTPQC